MVLSNFLVDEQSDASEVGLFPLTALLCTVLCNLLLLNNKQNKNCCLSQPACFSEENTLKVQPV